MKRSWPAVAALLAAGLLPAAASTSNSGIRAAASPSGGGIRVLRTAQPVEHIAADGPRIAVAMAARKMGFCDEIVVWSPQKRNIVRFYPGSNCNTAPTIDDIQEFALAGKTVYWLDADGGLSISLQVFRRTLGTNKTEPVSPVGSYSLSAYEYGEYGPYAFLGNLFGAGNLVVFNSWKSCMEMPAGSFDVTCPQAAPGNKPVILYSDQKLLKVVNGTDVGIVSAPDTQVSAPDVAYQLSPVTTAVAPAVVAVDANRIAAQNADGSVVIYSAGGAALQSIPIPSGKFSGFALQGSQLATIRNDRLELYDASSGKLVKTTRLPCRLVAARPPEGVGGLRHWARREILKPRLRHVRLSQGSRSASLGRKGRDLLGAGHECKESGPLDARNKLRGCSDRSLRALLLLHSRARSRSRARRLRASVHHSQKAPLDLDYEGLRLKNTPSSLIRPIPTRLPSISSSTNS